MSSKTQSVGHFVEYRLKRIVNSSSDGAVKRHLWQIYAGESGQPGRYSGALGTVFTGFTRRNVKQKRCANPCTMGCLYCTDVVCASSTGQRFAEGIYVSARKRSGKAVACLIHGEDDKTRIQRRFNVLATSADIQELAHHLRGMIQLLRSEGIPLDYPSWPKIYTCIKTRITGPRFD